MKSICIFHLMMYVISTATASPALKRKLLKVGFHREIETKLQLPGQFVKDCAGSSLLMFETLSTGIYADPFHIESQEQFGGLQVHFVQSVDIEAAEFASKPLDLYIFVNISDISLEIKKDVLETTVVLPIHARYHQISTDANVTHASVMILNPGLYTNCLEGGQINNHTLFAPCKVRSLDVCTWHHLPYQSAASHLVMKVPVGQSKHKFLVIVGTILVSIIVSTVLVKVILSSKNTKCDKLS